MLNPLGINGPPFAQIHVFPSADLAPIIAYDPKDRSLLAYTNPQEDRLLHLNKTGGSGGSYNHDDFIEDYCIDCDYYFDTKVESSTDDDGNYVRTITTSKCPAHEDGIGDIFRKAFACDEGHSFYNAQSEAQSNQQLEHDFELPQLMLEYRPDGELNAGLCRWRYDSEQNVLCTTLAEGVYNVGGNFGPVCWGTGEPEGFSAQVTQFLASEFNEDLLERCQFEEIADRQSRLILQERHNLVILRHNGPSENRLPNAVIFMNHLDSYALMQLTASGLKAEDCPFGMVPLFASRYADINGFITPPLPAIPDRCWFFSVDGQMLGQVPSSLLSCTTPLFASAQPC